MSLKYGRRSRLRKRLLFLGFEYFRTTVLDAMDYFAKHVTGGVKPTMNRKQFGAMLGGTRRLRAKWAGLDTRFVVCDGTVLDAVEL